MVLPIQRNHTISAGYNHNLAIKKNGSIVQWGITGNGRTKGLNNIQKNEDYVAVSAGFDDSIALTENGSIVQWGYTFDGQDKGRPTGEGYVAISAGGSHSIALKNDGSIVQWGNAGSGVTNGLNNIQKNKDYVAIAAGELHNIALKKDGSIVQWGNADSDQAKGKPTGKGYVAISAGHWYNLALKKDGSIVQWGDTSLRVIKNQPEPTETGFVAIAVGEYHALALKNDGSIVQWGVRTTGQAIGLNNIKKEKDYVAISAGYRHNLALKKNGSIVQWGNPRDGRTNGLNKIQQEKFMIPNERRRLPKNSSNNYKTILENRNLFNKEKFKNFEKLLKNKNNAERKKIILQRTNFLNNTKNAVNLVNRPALYNTSNLMTQEVIKKILNSTKVSAAVKTKYINQYKGQLSLKMIQNFKLNSENTLKLLVDKRVVKTNLLKNIMNSNVTNKVKLGFIKKTMNKNGMNKTLLALNKIKKIDANFTNCPISMGNSNRVLMNNMSINNKGKLKFCHTWSQEGLRGWNENTHPLTRASGWMEVKNSARPISKMWGAGTTNNVKSIINMPNKPTGKRAIRTTVPIKSFKK